MTDEEKRYMTALLKKSCAYNGLRILEELEKENKQLKWEFNEVVKDNDYYQKENKELSNSVTELTNTKTELEKKVTELKQQIEKMKSITEELIKIQSLSIEDDYNAGLFNGFVTIFNSIFEEKYQCCKWNEKKE